MSENKQKIKILPLHMKPIGETLAHEHCIQCNLQEGTTEYKDEYEKYMFNFYDEAHGLSLTPSGLIGQNPATPKVKEEFFQEISGIFGKSGLINKLPKADAYTKLKYDRILRGNITSIAHFILESLYGLSIKRGSTISSFEYGQQPTESEREIVIMNQYTRLFFIAKISKAIEEVIAESADGDISIANLLHDAFGESWDESQNRAFQFLNHTERRKEFIAHYYNDKKSYKKSNPVKSSNPKKSNPTIIEPDYGFSFDKFAIMELLDSHTHEDITPVTANAEFCKNINLSEKDVERADLTTPVVFGTVLKDNKKDYFVIVGHDRVLKAVSLRLPSLDAIVLDEDETKTFMV